MADAFPPAPFDVALKQMAIYDAYYSNQLELLTGNAGSPVTHVRNGVGYSGGLQGVIAKATIGVPAGENRSSLGIPVAGDLAQLSADLLFGEPAKITLPDSTDTTDEKATPERKAAQERLELIMSSDEAHAEMLRSGEYAAAHGGAYLGVVWDASVLDHVWFRTYRADCALPEYKYGRLTAVTLWTDYEKEDDTYRLLERHTPGFITYSLWKGETGVKGRQVPLDTIEETAHYLAIRDVSGKEILPEAETLDQVVRTGVQWLAVEFYPNMLPNPMWDKKGVLANLGRSDFYGLESLFDRINGIWSSLMRDFDNGAGRLTVPESYLRLNGPGKGASFDMGRQIYSPVGGLVDDGKGGTITLSQFEIRVDEHLGTIEALKRQIAQTAGYSVSHFGIHDTGTKTATEVNDDRTDSERTRDKKAMYVRPALARLARTALAIDGFVFPGKGGAVIEDLPDIEFAEVSQVDPESRARTIQMLDAARSVSIRTKVRMAQPGLDEQEADEEADAIRVENGLAPSTDPTTFTGDGPPPDEVP
ncbi:hypothetical protein B7R22_17135 [Subtercola boreus]|uniref:Phage portal protein n=1 Tax=Subtercola boreus TaxID=120213 RepID=A0A3E0VQ82_9MICO|nr:phage portal protein [Subtercola boreus]RFA12154.1 hypothetical protein B7R22_17135 [Subtercola boreus]